PLMALAARDGGIVGLCGSSAAAPAPAPAPAPASGTAPAPGAAAPARAPAPAPAPAGAPPAPGSAAPAPWPALGLPLREAWRLARPNAQLWVPPPEAKSPGLVYLVSRGVLECIEMSPRGGSVWHRFLGPGFRAPLWAEGLLVLAYDDRLAAVRAATGEPLWCCEMPLRAAAWQAAPPYAVIVKAGADYVPGEQLALADLATGRLLWSRPIETGRRSFRFFLAAACGPNIHVFGEASGPAAPRGVEVIVRAADGEVQNVRPFPPGEEERLAAVAVEGATGWCLAGGGSLWEFSVGGSRAPRRVASLEDLNPRLAFTIRTVGPWLQVQQKGSRGTWTERQWILRRDGAGQVLRLDHGGDIWGDALYWSVSRGVGALDLRTGNEMSLEVPPAASAAGFWDVFGCHRAKDRVWVASRLVVGREAAPGGMQLDVFDAATGEHRGSQALTQVLPARGISPFSLRRDGQEREEGPPAAGSEIVWAPDAVYVTDPRGVYALAPAPPGAATDGTAWLVCAAPGPVSIDGHLADWDEGGAFAPAAGRHASASEGRRDAGAGRLYLAHGDGHLYLAVRYATGQKVPRAGSADAGGGSRLEIGLATNKDAYRWSLGSDARGRAAWESLAAGSPVRGPRGAVRYDAAAGELIYEAALPLGDLVTSSTSGGEPQRMGLSAAAWDEAGGTGPVKAVEWGAGLAGRGVSEAGHQPIYLYPLPRRAAAAMQAVVDELPELPESFEHFRRAAATRAESDDALLALYGDFMKRYPRSMTVERLLALDQGLRARGGDPGRRLLEQAEAAGVAPATCRRYAVEAEAHLSQWIFIEHGLQPRGIVLELADGISPGQAGWDHRAAWNKPVLSSARPAYQAQERLPSGQWYEIRVPLAMLNMNGVPLCGISFGQQGGPRVVWDRSAVVYGGREEVFLDDGPPEGARVGGPWEWLDQPVQSGARAHAGEAPPGRYDVTYHWAADFLRPVTAHVQPPEGPYISQWIYLDPSAPPRTASLALHDGRAWRCHAVWGEKTRHGRYMGPLPAAGGWAELRLPIAWTGLASDPVAGLGFGQGPGRLFWGRTALAAGGRETPIVDGSLPPASPRAARGWLPWADGYIGYAWPTSGKAGFGLSLDGSTGYLEVPHTPALEPQELTIEAWILPRTAYSHDPRRWVVNKNTNEEADGHYALMTNKSSVGAYLNIGGTKANMFEAWSDQGALAAGKWSHVAMTYDGKDLKVYANGKCAARTAVNRPRTTGAATALAVGRRQDGYSYFTGVLDEVAVYGRAMTDEEARARYAADGAPPAPDAPGIVLYRGFDEDVMPQDTASGWEWAERPSRGGRPSHTQGAPAAYGGHVCLLREPILGHLPYDTGRAMAVLRREVPNLGATEEAWRLFGRMLQIQPTPEGRVELYRWFIQSLPQHPRAPESLRMLAEGCRQLGRPDAAVAEDVAAAVRSSNLPDETVFAYYRKYGGGARSFVTAWQVIGPFPNPAGQWHDPPLPPETQAVRLDASYDGVKGKVQWKRLESDGGYLDLGRTLDAGEFILAYAACWVRSDRAQPVVIEVSQDDTSKVWVNRQLVINSSPKGGHSSSYTLSATVQLPAGWSEILVKAGNSERNWGFSLEVLDPHGTGPPQGVEFQATPPPPGP
ncbi:MAG: hypothetical protein FJ288_16790, partial [Planctomycetes bacterium]|nr:hypothetical protein [Planctomycetota bacterium]